MYEKIAYDVKPRIWIWELGSVGNISKIFEIPFINLLII